MCRKLRQEALNDFCTYVHKICSFGHSLALSYDNCGAYKLQLMVANIHKADQSFSLAELRGRYCGAAIKPTDQTDGRRPADQDFCV